ncbi:hypothetical protein KR074_006267 [Drosophila pseudoananassae]|nr:hypothetical protein KR074_006267 [Drosophila pseudoananassae]
MKITSHWMNWCRLCAKDDATTNVKLQRSEQTCPQTWDNVLIGAIRKFFEVHMILDDELSNVLCTECYTLISELIDFAEHVTKVQAIFEVVLRRKGDMKLDVAALRQQYGLCVDDWSHIIKPMPSPELQHKNRPKEGSPNKTNYGQQAETNFEFGPLSNDTPNKNDFGNGRVPKKEMESHPNNLDFDILKREFIDLGPILMDNTLVNHSSHEDMEDVIVTSNYPIESRLNLSSSSNSIQDIKFEARASSGMESAHNSEPTSTLEDDGVLSVFPEANVLKLNKKHKRGRMDCGKCGKGYRNPASYIKHTERECQKVNQEVKTAKTTFCDVCQKTLSSVTALKLHKAGMHQNVKPYICDSCGKQLKTITALNEHKLVHTDNRPFVCTICKAGFKNRARLKAHHQIHEEPSFVCNICGKKLQTRRTWNMHKVVHIEERRLKCDVCGALFKRSKTLKTHLLSHTGLRPYLCNFCGKSFACNANCRSHKEKKHAGEMEKGDGMLQPSRLSVPTLEELRVM